MMWFERHHRIEIGFWTSVGAILGFGSVLFVAKALAFAIGFLKGLFA